jgi:hypothetical protein
MVDSQQSRSSDEGLNDKAWKAQSQSLVEVQKRGGDLEHEVAHVLGWGGGKAVYDFKHRYTLQVDAAYPSVTSPNIVVSVTYTNPDKRGHSNENKFHLKVGELALLKHAYPNIRCVLAIGGSEDTWLPYVLKAFKTFYDEVLFLWNSQDLERLREIRNKPDSVKAMNQALWKDLKQEWDNITLAETEDVVPRGLVRYKILDILKAQPKVYHPSLIENEIARLCMQSSRDASGAEWESYLAGRWQSIEMSRNYFNPVEATVQIALRHSKLAFQGTISQNVEVPSLLHDLGMVGTRVSEDFVLYSERLNKPVYIQCKASGGGRGQHGKNIQNRTKEQITRSLIYRCRLKNGQINCEKKNFHWISILDGDWAVTERQPLKYVHMLQWAGYDKLIGASELLNENFEAKRKDNPLVDYLINNLACRTISQSS